MHIIIKTDKTTIETSDPKFAKEFISSYLEPEVEENSVETLSLNEEVMRCMPKDFKDFLIENNAIYDYVSSFDLKFRESNIKTFFRYENVQSYFTRAFHWATTPNGSAFWSDLNEKWVDYVRSWVPQAHI